MTAPDPAQMLRDWLGQWEQMANQMGGEMLRSPEFTRAMHGAQSAALAAQENIQPLTDRALAAANMPSRAEIADLSARLGRIEAQLARIEAAVGTTPPTFPERAKPGRTRRPASTD